MELDLNKISKKRTIHIFDDGSRSFSSGNVMSAPSRVTLVDQVDLTDATDDEFAKIRAKPHDDKLLKQVTNRIDKEKKDKLK